MTRNDPKQLERLLPAGRTRRGKVTVRVHREQDRTTKVVRVNGRIQLIHIVELQRPKVDCDKLPDGLFQGARPDHNPFYADAVLNLEVDMNYDYAYRGLRGYLWLPIEDSASIVPSLDWLRHAVSVVTQWRRQGWRVLIHCTAGLSRSSLVSVAYYMSAKHMTRDAALTMIRSCRENAQPNPGFMQLLQEYEQSLAANS